MMEWFIDFNTVPVLLMQKGGVLPPLFNNRAFDGTTLLLVAGILAVLTGAFVFAAYRYQRWTQFSRFEREMKSLDLDTESEDTFAGMVKRYIKDEPVTILYSERLFDEMAAREIKRILASPGSAEAKENFINSIYKIRNRTYHPDWITANNQELINPAPRKERKAEQRSRSHDTTS